MERVCRGLGIVGVSMWRPGSGKRLPDLWGRPNMDVEPTRVWDGGGHEEDYLSLRFDWHGCDGVFFAEEDERGRAELGPRAPQRYGRGLPTCRRLRLTTIR